MTKMSNNQVAENAPRLDTSSAVRHLLPPSKLSEIRTIMGRQDVQELGKEIHLFAHLLIVADGCITGTPEQIGRLLSTDGRNGMNWAKKLDEAGKVTITTMAHRQVQIQLREPFLSVAAIKEEAIPEACPSIPDDPELANLMAIYRTAKATGQEVELKTFKRIDYGKPSHN